MPSKKPASPVPQQTVSDTTLDATPARALQFLRAIGTAENISAAMVQKGYGPADHNEGWTLLHAVSGFRAGEALEAPDKRVSDAIAELDAWDEDGLRVVRATLTRRHPAIAAFVMDSLTASQGPAAVLGVGTLLDRLDALESDPARKATKKDDHAALELLAKRGLDSAERA